MKPHHLSIALVGLLLISLVMTAGAGVRAAPGAQPANEPAITPFPLPMVALTADGMVRAWPDNGGDALGVIPARSSVPVSGRTQDSGWWQIPFAVGPGGYGWLAAAVVLPNDMAAGVPAIQVVVPARVPATPEPQPIPQTCTLDAAFVADVTIPDGTIAPPAQPVHKVWRLRNTGTCPWDASTVLKFVSGFQMSGPLTATFPTTQAGATVDIGVTAYAPSQKGTYHSVWQLLDEGVNLFGPQLTMVLQVNTAGPPKPPTPTPLPPAPPPDPAIKFWADSTRISAGKCTMLRWDVRHVQAVYLQYGGKTRGVAGQDAQSVCPSVQGQDYFLRIVRQDGGQDARSVHIDIKNAPPGPVSLDLSANPRTLLQQDGSQCTTVSWRVTGATRVEYQGGAVSAVGSQSECPRQTTIYRVRATASDGQTYDRALTVDVKWGGLITPEPTDITTPEPTDEPTLEPTDEPTLEPTDQPTLEPTDEPTEEPTLEPTEEPAPEPTYEPAPEPTYEPAPEPEPTDEPAPAPVYPDNSDDNNG
jgi:hypothetical protein